MTIHDYPDRPGRPLTARHFARRALGGALTAALAFTGMALGTAPASAADDGVGASIPQDWPGNTANPYPGGQDYYLDYTAGNDANPGTSPAQAWKTLAKASATTFAPGDRILLKAGETWQNEQLWPKGSGAPGRPIVIDVYGSADAGRPYIAANGTTPSPFANATPNDFAKDPATIGTTGAVTLRNQQYWEIHNLEISNDNDFDTDIQTDKVVRDGVSITINADLFAVGETDLIMDYFRVSNLYIHDVDGRSSWQQVHYGGICFQVFGADPFFDYQDSAYYFQDVRIEDNTIIKTELHAVQFAFNWFYDRASGAAYNWTDSTGKNHEGWEQWWVRNKDLYSRNVYIGHNFVQNIGQGAIQLANTKDMTVEYNEIDGYLKRYTQVSCGLYLWAGADSVMQFNEVYGAAYAQYDGSPWDLEYTNYNVTYQFNYSHDNAAGWMSYMGNSYNSIARYNLSVNENGVIVKNMLSTNYAPTFFVNNVFIYDGAVMDYFHDETFRSPVYFLNNVFYNTSTVASTPWARDATRLRNAVFSNNAFYEASGTYAPWHPVDLNAVYGEPGFAFEDWTDYKQDNGVLNIRDSAAVFKLKENSPLVDAGRYDTHLGAEDFFATPLYYGTAPDIGIHEVVQGTQVASPSDPNPIEVGGLGKGNFAELGTATATGEDAPNLAANAIDGDFSTYWASAPGVNASTASPIILEVDFGEAKTFDLFYLDQFQVQGTPMKIGRWYIDRHDPETDTWIQVSTGTNLGTHHTWSAINTPVTAEKIRLRITGYTGGGNGQVGINEFQVFRTIPDPAAPAGADAVALVDANPTAASLPNNQARLQVALDGAIPESAIRLYDASGELLASLSVDDFTVEVVGDQATYTVKPSVFADLGTGQYTLRLGMVKSTPVSVVVNVVDTTALEQAIAEAAAKPADSTPAYAALQTALASARATLDATNRTKPAAGNTLSPAAVSVAEATVVAASAGYTAAKATAEQAAEEAKETATTAEARNALTESVTVLAGLNPATYTPESWAALQAAVTAAEAVAANPAASPADLAASLRAVIAAGATLVPAAPAVAAEGQMARTLLSALTVDLARLDPASYTPESWAALSTALADATALAANPATSAQQLAAAHARLSSLVTQLAPVPAKAAPVSRVKAAQSTVRLVVGGKATIPGYGYTAAGDASAVKWKSSKSSVASVSASGRITAKKAGKATITATAGGKTARIKVTVVAKKAASKVTSVSVTGVAKTQAVGKVSFAKVTWKSARATGVKAAFSSSNSAVLSVDKAGRVIAKAPGKATLTVKVGAKSKSIKVTVA